MHTNEELDSLLQMSLEDKITMSKLRITKFYEHYNGNIVVSFSGGKDSTVLLHLVRSLFPDVKGVFCESSICKQAWLRTGCNAFNLGKGMPLSFWTEQDVLQYILNEKIQIPAVYGDIIKVGNKLTTTGEHRTGCMFCPVGIHLYT